MVIFPLAPDQTIAQMWSNGARGGTNKTVAHSTFVQRFNQELSILLNFLASVSDFKTVSSFYSTEQNFVSDTVTIQEIA